VSKPIIVAILHCVPDQTRTIFTYRFAHGDFTRGDFLFGDFLLGDFLLGDFLLGDFLLGDLWLLLGFAHVCFVS
jgi:hypothetical protein